MHFSSDEYCWLRPVGILSMFAIYALESVPTKRIYIGHTRDISMRLEYHNSGYVKSTAQEKPWILIAIEMVEKKNEAMWIERSLKKSKGKRVKWLTKHRIEL